MWIKTGLTLSVALAVLAAVAVGGTGCGGGDSSWWDVWSGDEYYPDAGDIAVDPTPLTANTISHITVTFEVTDYTYLVRKESTLDADTHTLSIIAVARERDGQQGGWDGTVVIAATFPESGLWQVVIPQEGGRTVGVNLQVEPPEGTPAEDLWATDEYYPDLGDVVTEPDPVVANGFTHLTLSFLKTAYTELISQQSELDEAGRTLTITVTARDRLGQEGSWDGTVVVPVTFLESGVWRIVVQQRDNRQAVVDVFVEPPADTPVEDAWMGDSYLPNLGDVTTSPDPVTVNRLVHVTLSFHKTEFTELVGQESEIDPIGRTLTITVHARERANRTGDWDGTVVVPVTFLDRGVWTIVVPQQGGREAQVVLHVQPPENLWAGDSYIPNAGDVVAEPDPVVVNWLTHITVYFNKTAYTDLVSQEWVLDPGSRTLTILVYVQERADRQATWDGKVTVPVTFMAEGAWTIIIPQEGGGQATVDLYVNPEETP